MEIFWTRKTKRTTTKKTNNLANRPCILLPVSEHQILEELSNKTPRMTLLISALLAVMLAPFPVVVAQEQTPAAQGAHPSSNASPPTQENSSNKEKKQPIPSFLILGTIFNENALSFPGVQVRVRRTGEKKVLAQTHTNSRGEFAVRVPPGYEYEVMTHVKKYDDQILPVDSKVDVQQRLSIKLQPHAAKKAEGK